MGENKTPWTPGPWTVRDYNADAIGRMTRFEGPAVIYADDDCDIHPIADCSCNHSCRLGDEQFANAHLIAAAPMLYEACQLALDAFEKNHAIDWGILAAALAAARNEDK